MLFDSLKKNFFFDISIHFRERERESTCTSQLWGEAEGEGRESPQADSLLSGEPDPLLDPRTPKS